MFKVFKNNYVQICTVIIGICFFSFFIGCEPKVESLFYDNEQVTGRELKIELDTLLAIAKSRNADLAEQSRLRNMILQNVLIIAESGTVNPVGLLTGLFAFYGVGSAANQTKNAVKKKLKNGTS